MTDYEMRGFIDRLEYFYHNLAAMVKPGRIVYPANPPGLMMHRKWAFYGTFLYFDNYSAFTTTDRLKLDGRLYGDNTSVDFGCTQWIPLSSDHPTIAGFTLYDGHGIPLEQYVVHVEELKLIKSKHENWEYSYNMKYKLLRHIDLLAQIKLQSAIMGIDTRY